MPSTTMSCTFNSQRQSLLQNFLLQSALQTVRRKLPLSESFSKVVQHAGTAGPPFSPLTSDRREIQRFRRVNRNLFMLGHIIYTRLPKDKSPSLSRVTDYHSMTFTGVRQTLFTRRSPAAFHLSNVQQHSAHLTRGKIICGTLMDSTSDLRAATSIQKNFEFRTSVQNTCYCEHFVCPNQQA